LIVATVGFFDGFCGAIERQACKGKHHFLTVEGAVGPDHQFEVVATHHPLCVL